MAEYYGQRASAGLIVAEGTQISPMGQGYAWTPGIYSDQQIVGWKLVTDEVHAKGGTIFAQLWHVGRVTHPDNIGGKQPVSASAIKAENVRVFVDNGSDQPGFVDVVEPRALTVDEIAAIIEEYAQAARNAVAAGFDGIELHGANGYLVNQFIDSESNARTDQYGGSLENRLRFLDEVVAAMVAAIGAERVGVRLAPLTTLNGTVDAKPQQTYTAAAELLNKHQIAYLHIAEADWDDAPEMSEQFKQELRSAFSGVLIYAGKYTAERAVAAIESGWADMIGFGRPFVANPDLPYRLQHGVPWAAHNPETLFGGGAAGLTDYPACDQQATTEGSAELLLSAIGIGDEQLANRIAMAPMTRSRTDQPGDVPNALMAEYYQQRAGAGLIITEGAPISDVGRGYSMTPGIYTQAHIDGWKRVTEAVHAKGGKIFIQLWHVGRRSHSTIAGQTPVAPSAVKNPDQVFGPLPEGGFGMIETDMPRAMTQQDIDDTIADFVQAAKNSIAAGFDGVELHGAHGYLLDQFLRTTSNHRTDEYGGSAENRLRFPLQVTQAVVDAIGGDKVAIRLSPFVTEGQADADPQIADLTLQLIERLAPMKLAYLHFSENISNYTQMPDSYRQQVRAIYPQPIMVAGKYTQQAATDVINKGYADLVAFGQPFITNPDLVERIRHGIALTPVDYDAHATFYGGGAEGYTDYPTATAD
ncbi:hypothetical protein GCM10011369_26530 [Neiella marina]|uniref:NADH:flavin oxidoreductase/NADH oxidase N-terminal domain-containing protein n=1 Tax=Neiella marina TaxID=508461 RepID=A0A8J2U708_9GAMM|nr:hypothetical protein GCM10011369_26530 [Neiella marina]